MNLSELWRDFAGPIPTKLSFINNKKDIDQTLLDQIELARVKYIEIPQFKIYFSNPPNAPKVRIQWAESRRCVLDVIENLPLSRNTWISLSHSSSESIVIGCQSLTESMTGIGVDLEKRDRKIEPGAAKKFVLPKEAALGLDSIAIWTIKEASYKADSTRQGNVVSDYEIKDFDQKSSGGHVGLREENSSFVRFKFVKYKDLVVSFAIAEVSKILKK